MARSAKKAKCTVTITKRAAQELKSIQAANAKDEQHVLRIDTESEGFSLWLGPEQEGDTLVGSEDTVILRATPELTKFLVQTSVVIDCMDHPDGTAPCRLPGRRPSARGVETQEEDSSHCAEAQEPRSRSREVHPFWRCYLPMNLLFRRCHHDMRGCGCVCRGASSSLMF